MGPPNDPSIPDAFRVLGEHYRLVEKLGEGAFGVVYRAQHDLLDQEFAVKLLKPELCQDETVRQRFLDEARALIRFSHPNVVQLRHVGEQEGRLYLVMDLVRGEPLDVILRKRGAFAEEQAVGIILQVLEGLEAAHAAGIVHRDLKPSNLLVELEGGRDRVRILDFGLSKLSAIDGAKGAQRSTTGTIIGTLAYMSPEQIAGDRDVDGRSDVFATGLVLRELLAGRHPYPGESGIVVAAKILRDGIPPIDAKQVKNISEQVRQALDQALESDRDARFPSALAFAQALEGKGPPSDTSRVTTVDHVRQQLARKEAEQARRAALARSDRAKRVRTVLLAGGILGAVGVGAFFAFQGAGRGETTPAAGPETAATGGATSPRTPEPGTPEPGTPEPGTPEPGTPEPGVPEPGTPEPAPPEPAAPEPDTPEPATPEPTPEPTQPEPVTPQPSPPEPTPPDEPVDPPPAPVRGPHSVEAARALAAEGKWAEAATVWREVLTENPNDVVALRGTAETWLAAADTLARSGQPTEALAALDSFVGWLSEKKTAYEEASRRDSATMREPFGFLLTYLGEAQTERARWLEMLGRSDDHDAAMKAAEDAFVFAGQFLSRDGIPGWEYLLRRAEWHRLRDDYVAYLQDLAVTTQTDNLEVPTHMWVAHAAGLRHAAEVRMVRREPRRAAIMAAEALTIIKKGITWTRSKREVFTRNQWLEAARVVFVNDLVQPTEEDRTALHGLMKWYLEQAAEQPQPTWESDVLASSRLATLQAALLALEGRLAAARGDDVAATRLYGEALERARSGVRSREALAEAGGELPEVLPYVVMAHVLRLSGRDPMAAEALGRAREAMATNPE